VFTAIPRQSRHRSPSSSSGPLDILTLGRVNHSVRVPVNWTGKLPTPNTNPETVQWYLFFFLTTSMPAADPGGE